MVRVGLGRRKLTPGGGGCTQVPAASQGGWASKWPSLFRTQEYDWTYSTDYCGEATMLRAAAEQGAGAAVVRSVGSAQGGLPFVGGGAPVPQGGRREANVEGPTTVAVGDRGGGGGESLVLGVY
jgi:hypothetical protein